MSNPSKDSTNSKDRRAESRQGGGVAALQLVGANGFEPLTYAL